MAEALTTHGNASAAEHADYLDYPKGLMSWLTTVDHKRIGLMYMWSVMFFFFVGGLFALLIRIELLTPKQTIMTAEMYNRVFTLHGAIMTFLVIIPAIPAALGNFALPLLIGAKDVAFPRLNLTSLYVYWAGALMAVTVLVMGGVDTGWTFYTPYSTTTGGGVTLMVMAAFVLGFSSIFTGVNFIATIHKLRAPGMGWGRRQAPPPRRAALRRLRDENAGGDPALALQGRAPNDRRDSNRDIRSLTSATPAP